MRIQAHVNSFINCHVVAKGLVAELAPLHVQSIWGSKGERV